MNMSCGSIHARRGDFAPNHLIGADGDGAAACRLGLDGGPRCRRIRRLSTAVPLPPPYFSPCFQSVQSPRFGPMRNTCGHEERRANSHRKRWLKHPKQSIQFVSSGSEYAMFAQLGKYQLPTSRVQTFNHYAPFQSINLNM